MDNRLSINVRAKMTRMAARNRLHLYCGDDVGPRVSVSLSDPKSVSRTREAVLWAWGVALGALGSGVPFSNYFTLMIWFVHHRGRWMWTFLNVLRKDCVRVISLREHHIEWTSPTPPLMGVQIVQWTLRRPWCIGRVILCVCGRSRIQKSKSSQNQATGPRTAIESIRIGT